MLDLGRTFLQSVERSPHALALVDGDVQLTYAQWHRMILSVADGLRELGLQRGDRLLVVLQNRWEMATLHWAGQFAGIVIVPINWRAKPDELDYCVTDSGAKAIVYEPVSAAAVAQSAAAQKVPRIGLDDASGATATFDTLIVERTRSGAASDTTHATADDISLILYTSGTTGKGKGVPRRHRHERAGALAHVAQNLYRRGERTLGVMPLYHTMGVRSLLAMALVDGLFVCVRRWNAKLALECISKHALTCLYLVPTLYHDLLADSAFPNTDTSSVRKLGFAGAPMNDGLLKRLSAAFEPELFVNHYGSSEVYTFSIDQDATRKPGSAGRAGINTRLRVVKLDALSPDELADTGEEGQIIVDLLGDEAFEGYWHRPDADAKSLRDGWYFTGDTGYLDRDGDLYVTGRVDDMIISGGENISPVDIESLLSLHPAVDEVAVAGVKDERWGQRVVAFIKRREYVDSESLDAWCRQSDLVNFKRPRDYVFVDDIPKSPVGKILRRKLQAGEYTTDSNTQAARPAETTITKE
ncbi:2-furoate---CoA ligase [Paraburkholderia sp. GV068]|uniref:AMP-dependent synthetase and ligase n=1 Tax=Paraburkholderia graminis (strain ATCC 700544 / DSM 17151 / LMG 18924 / NCIMB 13744 / C4D1M) TaxID=396598 RepID=B1FTX7_PARG4|nr:MULTISPECIES: AMP-binding protein [Paraburkholderia]EDT12993.1 AMP-dependent synthetase and ligase [Paraburkholderia graminis C4D1M]MDR6470039.1 2-furoate---CoA ligase [Paraburkholderia graminis]PTR01723.1 2-furoate---CoA ligase [Paraburkholderia sp. GV072]PUB05935.1 2-furoate---CoA ligase [Paraburkholderia sp. GV068]CAB3730522.1 4-chlorobenzoate--CoA ligase [Paraburkholderia graminis C4D1M]